MKAKIYTPVVTIFNKDGSINLNGNIRVMEHLIHGGVDGIVPLGSTGEYPSLSVTAKMNYLDKYINIAGGRIELLPGTGGENIDDTIRLSNHILDKHGDKIRGVLIISEFYYNMDADDFYRYYAHLAEKISGRIYIYNYPERTGHSIPPDVVVKLAGKYNNIVGLKDSVKDFRHTKDILEKIRSVRPDFEVFSGYDDQFLLNAWLGGAGGIGALSNIKPKLWSQWTKAVNDNDFRQQGAIYEQIKQLMTLYSLESNPQKLLKEILRELGLPIQTYCLFPFDQLKDGTLQKAMELIN